MGDTNDKNVPTTDGASNPPGTPPVPSPAPADEPRIIEEHIVAPPPKPAAPPPIPPKAPAPAPSMPEQILPVPPPPAQKAPAAPPPISPAPPEAPAIPKVATTPQQPPAPLPPTQPAASPVSEPSVSQPPTVPQSSEPGIATDISRIIAGIKLPERPQEDEKKPQRTYDTQLSSTAPDAQAQSAREANVREAARAVSDSLPQVASKMDEVRSVHTLKEDLQDVVRTNKISMVRAVALEEEKRHRPNVLADEQAVARRNKPIGTTILVALLILVGIGALGGMYLLLRERTAPIVAPSAQVIFAEQTIPFAVSHLAPADVKREIAGARTAGALTLGSILQIVPTKDTPDGGQTPMTFGDFIAAVGARPPAELTRAVGNEFFFGFHAVDEHAPVIVVPVTSYERAFAAMLDWEQTMNNDLAPIFTTVPTQTVGPDGVLVAREFTDEVLRNYDVRALTDDTGQIQLYYSFPTRTILVIAESPYSFTELLSRLRADRRL